MSQISCSSLEASNVESKRVFNAFLNAPLNKRILKLLCLSIIFVLPCTKFMLKVKALQNTASKACFKEEHGTPIDIKLTNRSGSFQKATHTLKV